MILGSGSASFEILPYAMCSIISRDASSMMKPWEKLLTSGDPTS
jgi:hypothetical protein